jgi:hypothetical protein
VGWTRAFVTVQINGNAVKNRSAFWKVTFVMRRNYYISLYTVVVLCCGVIDVWLHLGAELQAVC